MAETSLQAILRRLLPPLRYGAHDNFAHLHTLKFEALIQAVATQAAQAGAEPAMVDRLRALASGFDEASLAQRRAALEGLAQVLASAFELPPPLRSLAAAPAAAPAQPPAAPRARVAAPAASRPAAAPSPVSPAPKRGAPARPRELFDAAKAGAPAKAKLLGPAKRAPRPKAKAAPADGARAAESEVVYPAVSPTSGPLAMPLSAVGTVRGRLASTLKKRGMSKVGEVLFFFPRAYEDRRHPVPIARLEVGQRGVSVGTVRLVGEVPTGRRRILRVVLGDNTGTIAATWYNYPHWMRGRFKVGDVYVFSGEVRIFGGAREVAHPEMELAEKVLNDPTSFGRIVPIYPGFEKAEQHAFRDLAQKVVERFASQIEDPLPPALLGEIGLPALSKAVHQVHFPEESDLEALASHAFPSQRRLAFDELFFIQLGLALRRKGVKLTPGIRFRADAALLQRAASRLPFQLTGAQRRALGEIAADMARPEPMNRLLQGDVGSGKTAVAMVTALVAIENGFQAALMAPTEILAEQHYRNLSRWLEPAGYRVALLTAGVAKKKKDGTKEAVARGEVNLCIGTHAILQEDVEFAKLGVVVIDEQHRFGVMQRAALMQKGVRPDVLVMTATPIPRTLAMTLYGDLDLSILDELPPGRTPITTRVFTDRERERVYTAVAAELEKGRQAYVIYPLVEESEKLDLASATEGAAKLAERFPQFKVGLVHGRMKAEDKDAVMTAFRDGQVHLLVSTTVIEVGVDVPNSTVIVVEAAERFGLSQLHQLRGRVGRGSERSYCFLIGKAWNNEVAMQRLSIMERTTNGFEIAQEDLAIRGPGEFIGTRQSGVPGLMVADLARDRDLLAIAQKQALRLAEADPKLARPEHAALRRALDERWEGKLGLARVG